MDMQLCDTVMSIWAKSLRTVWSSLLNLCCEDQKRVQSKSCKVYFIKWPVSVSIKYETYVWNYVKWFKRVSYLKCSLSSLHSALCDNNLLDNFERIKSFLTVFSIFTSAKELMSVSNITHDVMNGFWWILLEMCVITKWRSDKIMAVTWIGGQVCFITFVIVQFPNFCK